MTKSNSIRVVERFGENLLTPEDGDILRALIHDDLSDGLNVVLDFGDVRIVASAFLNTAIGRLYADIPAETIKALLHVENLSDIGLFSLSRVVRNSKSYYEDALFRQAVDASNAALEAREA